MRELASLKDLEDHGFDLVCLVSHSEEDTVPGIQTAPGGGNERESPWVQRRVCIIFQENGTVH